MLWLAYLQPWRFSTTEDFKSTHKLLFPKAPAQYDRTMLPSQGPYDIISCRNVVTEPVCSTETKNAFQRLSTAAQTCWGGCHRQGLVALNRYSGSVVLHYSILKSFTNTILTACSTKFVTKASAGYVLFLNSPSLSDVCNSSLVRYQ